MSHATYNIDFISGKAWTNLIGQFKNKLYITDWKRSMVLFRGLFYWAYVV